MEAISQGWHEGRHDPHPWLRYFWGVLIAADKELEERVGSMSTGRGAKTERARAAVPRRLTSFAISDLENDCPDISREQIRKVLGQMRDEGLVRITGVGRSAKWHLLS